VTIDKRRALLATRTGVLASVLVGSTLGAVPAAAADTPPNPISKPGYFLTANDEFNVAGATLTPALWNAKYLQHWTTVDTSARYNISGGNLDLRIDPDTPPWDPAKDGDTRISSIQTAERNWLHNWAGYTSIANPQPTTAQHVQKYGYFEIRARTQRGGGIHSAWWMIGAQQDVVNGSGSQQTAEVDIFENVGRDPANPLVNLLRWSDPNLSQDTGVYNLGFNAADAYHVYGFEWTPNDMKFYADGRLIKTFNQSPRYPMLTLLGIYEKRVNGWTGPFDPSIPYPKVFSIDYFRAYQKIPTLPYTVEADDAALLGSARSAPVVNASGGRVAGWLGQGYGNRAVYNGLYAPSTGNRKLTLRYASGETRSVTYQVNGGAPVTISLPSSGGWTTFANHNINVSLNEGNNTIQFWNGTGWAPDLDTITVS
jgi:beta-glucanase (GH16 family)